MNRSILIVDDDEAFANTLANSMERKQLQTCVALTREQAILAASQRAFIEGRAREQGLTNVRIITADMIARMKPGAVVVDMAAETGGNVEGTVAGEKVWINDVLVIGPTNIASRMPVHASEMIAKNLFNFISPFIRDGALALDWEDEVMSGSCLTHAGEVRHAGVRQVLGL